MLTGAIDLGGTKTEAALFDAGFMLCTHRRIATPRSTIEDFMAALKAQINWLFAAGDGPDMPVGIGIPGFLDPASGRVNAANIVANGHLLPATLKGSFNRPFVFQNDCVALAVSEANGGAAAGTRVNVSLALGTGVGAGCCVNGDVPPRARDLPVEIGHCGVPARALARHNLPLWPCGCGRSGCFESYISGTGLARLAEWKTGRAHSSEEVVAQIMKGNRAALQVIDIWASLMAECLDVLRLTFDPQMIVLGGGLSQMPDIVAHLEHALERDCRHFGKAPPLAVARFGPRSGARGMAILARRAHGDNGQAASDRP